MNLILVTYLKILRYKCMILIWTDKVDKRGIKALFNIIENWEDFKAIIEHENAYYLISTKRIHDKMKGIDSFKNLSNSTVLKILKEVYKKKLYCMKMRFRKKENVLKKYKDEQIILFLNYE